MAGCHGNEDGVHLWTAGYLIGSTWHWKVDDKMIPVEYFNWKADEPSNLGGREACINMFSAHGYRWNDAWCLHKSCFVCQM